MIDDLLRAAAEYRERRERERALTSDSDDDRRLAMLKRWMEDDPAECVVMRPAIVTGASQVVDLSE